MISRRLNKWMRNVTRWELPFSMAVAILAVAIPTVGLLFFMDRALDGEREKMLNEVMVGRESVLNKAAASVREFLSQRLQSGEPSADSKQAPRDRFHLILENNLVHTCIVLGDSGEVVFPILTEVDREVERRGAEFRADALLESMGHEVAGSGMRPDLGKLLVLADSFSVARMQKVRTPSGRHIRPQALLAVLQEMPRSHARWSELVTALKNCVLSTAAEMPSSQRLYLADQLQKLGESIELPNLGAELAALRFASRDAVPRQMDEMVPAASDPELFALRPSNAGAVLFVRKALVLESMQKIAAAALAGQGLEGKIGPHGSWASGSPALALLGARPIGSLMPGWEIAAFGQDAMGAIDQRIGRKKTLSLVFAISGCLVIGSLAAWSIARFAARARMTQVKQDFLSIVSHELKTPLTSIRMFVDSLADGGLEDPERARTYLNFVRGENERLSRLVENFLTFSRLESGRMNFDFHIIHPEDVVYAVQAAVSGRVEQSGCDFEVNVDPDLPLVLADLSALTTMLVNLIDNAVKYSGEAKRVVLAVTHRGGEVFFSVTDNGIGMTAATIARLGEKFFRDHHAGDGGRGGFGLGLHIVRSIVDAHKGSLTITSTPGAGSCFVVSLPAQPKTAT